MAILLARITSKRYSSCSCWCCRRLVLPLSLSSLWSWCRAIDSPCLKLSNSTIVLRSLWIRRMCLLRFRARCVTICFMLNMKRTFIVMSRLSKSFLRNLEVTLCTKLMVKLSVAASIRSDWQTLTNCVVCCIKLPIKPNLTSTTYLNLTQPFQRRASLGLYEQDNNDDYHEQMFHPDLLIPLQKHIVRFIRCQPTAKDIILPG